MERKTQELVASRSRIERSRKRKQLYQLDGSDSFDSSTSKDAYKPRRRKIVSFFFQTYNHERNPPILIYL